MKCKCIGGLIHEVWEQKDAEGHFALKILNPVVMKRAGAKEQILLGEQIAQDFKAKGLPAVCASKQDGKILQQLPDGRFFLIYPWIDGQQKYYPDFGLTEVKIISSILAKIHSLGEISHRDFDPKNVLWMGDQPFIIDWEAAGPINPMEELVALAYEWSGFERGYCDEVLFQAFFEGYQQAGGVIVKEHLQSGLQGFIRNYQAWYTFNQERQARAQTEVERKFATEQLEKTQIKLNFLQQETTLRFV